MDYDPEKPLWSIMTKSRGGTVSVIRDLTLDQARRTYERLDPFYGQTEETLTVHKDFLEEGCIGMSSGGGACRTVSDGDIEVREVFGPPGWMWFDALNYWPKFYPIYTDDKWNVLPDEYQEHPERAAWRRDAQAARTTKIRPGAAPPAEKEAALKDWFSWMKP